MCNDVSINIKRPSLSYTGVPVYRAPELKGNVEGMKTSVRQQLLIHKRLSKELLRESVSVEMLQMLPQNPCVILC